MQRSMTHLLLAIALAQLSGCATFDSLKSRYSKPVTATADNPVTRIVCLWQPAEGRGLDDLPTRGFAGQIIFLTSQSPTPVQVDGDVTIYLFDDQGPPQQRAKPIHDFRFVDGSWKTHLKQTTWGPTYQIFVPYVPKGNHRAACSLAVRLDPKVGPHASSDLADIVLEGVGPIAGAPPSQVSISQQSFPAGRVHRPSQTTQHNRSAVAPASMHSDRHASAAMDAPGHHTRGFESFTIPYDLGKLPPREQIHFPQNR